MNLRSMLTLLCCSYIREALSYLYKKKAENVLMHIRGERNHCFKREVTAKVCVWELSGLVLLAHCMKREDMYVCINAWSFTPVFLMCSVLYYLFVKVGMHVRSVVVPSLSCSFIYIYTRLFWDCLTGELSGWLVTGLGPSLQLSSEVTSPDWAISSALTSDFQNEKNSIYMIRVSNIQVLLSVLLLVIRQLCGVIRKSLRLLSYRCAPLQNGQPHSIVTMESNLRTIVS